MGKWFPAVICMGFVLFTFFPIAYAKPSDAGIILSDDQGRILFSQNRNRAYIPASTLKILTSLAAIHILGEDHRFLTGYAYDEKIKALYVKGFGDPLLTSEVIETLAREMIQKEKIKEIHDIFLDQSYYKGKIDIPGKCDSLNPYDAPVGALCANFNTITFRWDKESKGFMSGEPQTPFLNYFINDIKKTGLKQGRIVLREPQSYIYPGLLIRHFLEKEMVRVTGSIQFGKIPAENEKHQVFFSPHGLKMIIRQLLQYSNNFIANQLFLSMGAKLYGEPATLEKGRQAVSDFAINRLSLKNLFIDEGSGLSSSNTISPDEMLKILVHFKPFYELMRHEENNYFKTGTLTGVRTLAGYLAGTGGRLYPYVIMVNEGNAGCESILAQLIAIMTQTEKNGR